MIQKLSIRNFKSIRELDLDCRRVNVFIGEPNTGKTNILESLAIHDLDTLELWQDVFRVDRLTDFFFQHDSAAGFYIRRDDFTTEGNLGNGPGVLRLSSYLPDGGPLNAHLTIFLKEKERTEVFGRQDDIEAISQYHSSYYIFRDNLKSEDPREESLSTPFGGNLASLVAFNKKAREIMASYFSNSQFRPLVDRSENKLLLAYEEDGTLIALPYSASSETLRRMVFHTLAIETNCQEVIIFDEPEAHSFPPYTKTLAERIALDEKGNQFFLTTHSPYMLDSLLSKTPASELNVVLCRMENFETKAYPMNQDQIDQIKEWSMDAFFNFDRLLPELK
jgi:AAA15 family ATPase/GTPase